ncbi:MAG: TonB-dependent receptor plug domain-containing protein [Luteolibacter sp.]
MLNLRGLGGRRIVNLVDGIPPTLPSNVIERIELLDDGASAEYGSDAIAGVVNFITKGTVGYDSNPHQLSDFKDDTFFMTGGVEALTKGGNGPFQYGIGAGINYTWFDDEPERTHNDETYDFSASAALRYEFNPSFVVSNFSSINGGAHQSVERGYLRSGIGFANSLDWRSISEARYNFIGQPIGSEGVEAATGFRISGFDESHTDDRDSLEYSIEQELGFNLASGVNVYGCGSVGRRDWDRRDDFNSDIFQLGGGVRTTFASGITLSAAGGWEHRDYDDLNLDRDEIYLNGVISGPLIKDKASFFFAADYGIQDSYLNLPSAGTNWVDPIGVKVSGGVRCSGVGPGELGLTVNVQRVETDLFSGVDQDVNTFSARLSYAYSPSRDLTVVPALTYFNNDFANGSVDGAGASLSVIKGF